MLLHQHFKLRQKYKLPYSASRTQPNLPQYGYFSRTILSILFWEFDIIKIQVEISTFK